MIEQDLLAEPIRLDSGAIWTIRRDNKERLVFYHGDRRPGGTHCIYIYTKDEVVLLGQGDCSAGLIRITQEINTGTFKPAEHGRPADKYLTDPANNQ